MRTNIVIDDKLMAEAIRLSDKQTKKETVEAALRLFVEFQRQQSIRNFRGKLKWEGNLDKMRRDS